MNTNVESKSVNIPLMLYDEQFSIAQWRTELAAKEKRSNEILEKIMKAISKDYAEDDFNLVLDIDNDFKKSYKSGEIKLEVAQNGDVFAQIKGANGRYGKKIPVKEELIEQGITTEELQLALQNEAIKGLLINILEVISEIDNKINDVLQGQNNDRLGLYFSGINLYIEAKCIEDEQLRKQIIAQSIRSISDANAQIIQEFRCDLQYLASKEYKKEKKQVEKINERMDRIKQNFEIIYRSYFLRAMIYSESNENVAMLSVLEQYGRFINQMIAPYSDLLTECDPYDTLLVDGTWEKRSKVLIECQNIRQALLMEDKVFYLVKED